MPRGKRPWYSAQNAKLPHIWRRELFDPAWKLTLFLLSSNPSTNHCAELTASRNTTRGARKLMPPIFFFRNCNYNYNQIVIYYGYNLYKIALISAQSLLHYQHTFSNFACHVLCPSYKTACWRVGAAHARCVSSTKRRPRSASFRGPKRWKLESTKQRL